MVHSFRLTLTAKINCVSCPQRNAGSVAAFLGTVHSMLRTIVGFRTDDAGDFVAELSCLHGQHVRHSPPFRIRPWVRTVEGRAAHVGTALDCPLCDRAELPHDLRTVRTAGPFDDATLPPGLRAPHRVAESTWGMLCVAQGRVRLAIDTDPPVEVELHQGDAHPIPPTVLHRIDLDGATITIDFLSR
jgi:tellurite methyltransferase